jgi:RNA polymerase sigma-70 factor (ECF subfamily)
MTRMQPATAGADGGRISIVWNSADTSRPRPGDSGPRPLGRTIRVGRPPNEEQDAYASGGFPAGSPFGGPEALEELIAQVARGDRDAFEAVYQQLAAPVYGLVRRVLRDPAQSEEVTQEVMVELWRTATRFDAKRGSVRTWAMTLAHRRAVDRVRSAQAATDRELRLARQAPVAGAEDDVAEVVEARLDQQRVRHCLGALTELQRESVRLAYYGGYTYREVAELLDAPLGTVKTRLRDGLIRLRDCLGATR